MTGVDKAWIAALVLAYAYSAAMIVWDASLTVKGVASGIADEEDKLPAMIFRVQHPTLFQYVIVRLAERSILAAAIALPHPDGLDHLWYSLAVVGLIVWGLKAMRCAYQWRWMFAHPGQTVPLGDTFWQKFFGFWG